MNILRCPRRPKTTLFCDEISTGLDSSTTFQIVKCIRNFVHFRRVRGASSHSLKSRFRRCETACRVLCKALLVYMLRSLLSCTQ